MDTNIKEIWLTITLLTDLICPDTFIHMDFTIWYLARFLYFFYLLSVTVFYKGIAAKFLGTYGYSAVFIYIFTHWQMAAENPGVWRTTTPPPLLLTTLPLLTRGENLDRALLDPLNSVWGISHKFAEHVNLNPAYGRSDPYLYYYYDSSFLLFDFLSGVLWGVYFIRPESSRYYKPIKFLLEAGGRILCTSSILPSGNPSTCISSSPYENDIKYGAVSAEIRSSSHSAA